MPMIMRTLTEKDSPIDAIQKQLMAGNASSGRNLMAYVTLGQEKVFEFYFPRFENIPEVEQFDILDVSAKRRLTLSSETLRSGTVNIMASVANFFIVDDEEFADDEVILNLSDCDQLHFCRLGNHIRVTTDGEEVAYWVCDEFTENPGEVLGALFGLMFKLADRKAC